MNEEILQKLGIANLPQETQATTLQGVALDVEVQIHQNASEVLEEKQLETLQNKSQQSPEATYEWLMRVSPKLAKQYKANLTAYLDEKTTTT